MSRRSLIDQIGSRVTLSVRVLSAIDRSHHRDAVVELLAFGYKQARACVFAGSFFALLFFSTRIDFGALHRYDVIFVGALAIQTVLIATGRETRDELWVICAFHVLGFMLETFKTHPAIASWNYPEDGWTKVGTVPLYSGFMYAAVASYMVQAWRLLDLRLVRYPPRSATVPICLAVYANFFSNAFVADVRWWLLAVILIAFGRTRVEFTPLRRRLWMPLPASLVLIALFVWVAENISTFFGAWQYPNQANGWAAVEFDKMTSWTLLVVVTFVLVAELKHVKAATLQRSTNTRPTTSDDADEDRPPPSETRPSPA